MMREEYSKGWNGNMFYKSTNTSAVLDNTATSSLPDTTSGTHPTETMLSGGVLGSPDFEQAKSDNSERLK
jgi:hypothetical protein